MNVILTIENNNLSYQGYPVTFETQEVRTEIEACLPKYSVIRGSIELDPKYRVEITKGLNRYVAKICLSEEKKNLKTVGLKFDKDMCKVLPTMPDGTLIPNIVKDSMSIDIEPELSKAGYVVLNLSVYIKAEELENLKDNLKMFPGKINAKF